MKMPTDKNGVVPARDRSSMLGRAKRTLLLPHNNNKLKKNRRATSLRGLKKSTKIERLVSGSLMKRPSSSRNTRLAAKSTTASSRNSSSRSEEAI